MFHGTSRKRWGNIYWKFCHEAARICLIWGRRLWEPSLLFTFEIQVKKIRLFPNSERWVFTYSSKKFWKLRIFYFLLYISPNMQGCRLAKVAFFNCSETIFFFWNYHCSCNNKVHSFVWTLFSISCKSLMKKKNCDCPYLTRPLHYPRRRRTWPAPLSGSGTTFVSLLGFADNTRVGKYAGAGVMPCTLVSEVVTFTCHEISSVFLFRLHVTLVWQFHWPQSVMVYTAVHHRYSMGRNAHDFEETVRAYSVL